MELTDSSPEHTLEEDYSTGQFVAGKHTYKRKKKLTNHGNRLEYYSNLVILTHKHIWDNKAWYLSVRYMHWMWFSNLGNMSFAGTCTIRESGGSPCQDSGPRSSPHYYRLNRRKQCCRHFYIIPGM
jgi:hypothetical protein